MPNLNQVNLMGHVGKEPEMKYSANGNAVLTFSIAVNSGWGDNKRTDWIDCVMFGNRAESVSEFIGKGDPLFVSGSIQINDWQDKEGNKRRGFNIVVNQVELLRGRTQEAGATKSKAPTQDGEDDLPF